MAKYLVTGGAGFIGSNIVKRLVEEGQGFAFWITSQLEKEKILNHF